MRDQIVVSENGQSGIAIPLYRWPQETLARVDGYVIALTSERPLAYTMDFGPELGAPVLMSAEFVEKRFTFIGDFDTPTALSTPTASVPDKEGDT